MSAREGTMINKLLKSKAWVDSLDDEKRRAIVNRLLKIIATDSSSNREVTAAIRALATLEKNDIEKSKVEVQHDIGVQVAEAITRREVSGRSVEEIRALLAEVQKVKKL